VRHASSVDRVGPSVLRCAAMLALASACARPTEYVDSGHACLGPTEVRVDGADDQPTFQIADGGTVDVWVVVAECVSGSTDWTELSCAADVDGDTVRVTSFAKAHTPAGPIDPDCNDVTVACATPALVAGDWNLSYGGDTIGFEVPYDGEAICAGRRGGGGGGCGGDLGGQDLRRRAGALLRGLTAPGEAARA
jgi:hypothetical protein